MTEAMKKVLTTQNLRKQPQRLSEFLVSPSGNALQVQAGENVKTGAKPSQDEITDDGKFTWVFVEATNGLFVDLRKGYVSEGALVSTDIPVETSEGFKAFLEQVEKESFANACYVQAMLSKTNPAYLYALAFSLSGEQWSDTLVKTNDAADARAIGVFRFPKETWQSLLSEPEAEGIQADQIKFPNAQCVVAAIVAEKSANLLKGLITDRPLSAVDLFLAHLFADDKSFGSNAAARILQAATDNKDQLSNVVIEEEIYPDSALRTAFFKRNADIFKEDGSASIDQALKACADKLDSGFAEVANLSNGLAAEDSEGCQASLFEGSIPSKPGDPILGGVEGSAGTGTGGGVIETQQKVARTRKLAISPQLRDILEYAGRKTGIDVEVYSGGQPPAGPDRTGSHRHDVGSGLMGAADLYMHDAKTKRKLDSDNLADRARMAAFMEASAAAGAIGIGHAPDYMGTKSTHIGGGQPVAVWGAGNSRQGAPGWVIEAFERGRARALSPAQFAANLQQMRAAPIGTTDGEETSAENVTALANVTPLAGVRKRFIDELQKPDMRRLLAASTAAEVGGQGSKAEQYYIESVFNRAAARNRSLEETVRDSAYYPSTTTSKLDNPVGSAAQARINGIIDSVMAGANESNFATGNESGRVHSGGAPVTRDLGPGRERFVRELGDLRWVRRMEATAVRGDSIA